MSSDIGDHPNGQTFLVEAMYKTEFSTEKFAHAIRLISVKSGSSGFI